MNERLKAQGHLLEEKEKRRGLELRIRGMVDVVRDCLDPLGEIADLRADMAAEHALDLARLHIEWLETTAKILQIKKALGRD